MKFIKKAFALATLVAIFSSSVTTLDAQTCYTTDAGGCGYAECRRAPCITPAVALGTIALVAIIAIAVQNSSGSGAHAHAHCD